MRVTFLCGRFEIFDFAFGFIEVSFGKRKFVLKRSDFLISLKKSLIELDGWVKWISRIEIVRGVGTGGERRCSRGSVRLGGDAEVARAETWSEMRWSRNDKMQWERLVGRVTPKSGRETCDQPDISCHPSPTHSPSCSQPLQLPPSSRQPQSSGQVRQIASPLSVQIQPAYQGTAVRYFCSTAGRSSVLLTSLILS